VQNKDYFRDFLSLENDTFEAYCRRIGRTNTWGGQHEIIALCHVLRRNIQVFRHDMTIQCFPDPETDSRAPYTGPPLRLSYHMHEYTCGEHYNSIVEANDLGKPTRVNRENRGRALRLPASPLLDLDSSESDDSDASLDSEGGKAASKDDDQVWNPKARRKGNGNGVVKSKRAAEALAVSSSDSEVDSQYEPSEEEHSSPHQR